MFKRLWDSNYIINILISQNSLILILNRGKRNIYDVKLDFRETMEIIQFDLQKEKPNINIY